jgi:hypothetical protein
MTTIAIIFNIVFAVGVVAGIVGMLVWSVATQHRDHGVLTAGRLTRRRMWSGVSRPHAARRPWIPARGAASPVA